MKDEDEELIGVSLGVSEEQLRLLYGDRTSFLEQQLLRLEGVRTSALNETRITEEEIERWKQNREKASR
jgi:hypothetical protein